MAVDPRFNAKTKPRNKNNTPEVPLWAWQTQQPTRYMEGMPAGAVAASTSVAPPAERIPTDYVNVNDDAFARDFRVQDDIDYRSVYEPQVQPNADSLTSAIKQRLMAQRAAGVGAAPMNMQQQYERPETLPFDLEEKTRVDYEENRRRGVPAGLFEGIPPMKGILVAPGEVGSTAKMYQKEKAQGQGKMMRKEKLEEPRQMPKVVVPD